MMGAFVCFVRVDHFQDENNTLSLLTWTIVFAFILQQGWYGILSRIFSRHNAGGRPEDSGDD